MRELIMSQKFVTCPWGGWGQHRENVINGWFNDRQPVEIGGRSSRGQDRRFVEEMSIGDIVVIPFADIKKCFIVEITSNVEYGIDSGLKRKEDNGEIRIGDNDGLPFQPVGRRVAVISNNFIPEKSLGQLTLCKLNKNVVAKITQSFQYLSVTLSHEKEIVSDL
jgi:hypothetical protein